jgi:thiol-disulfide isomerase/thioredoxin
MSKILKKLAFVAVLALALPGAASRGAEPFDLDAYRGKVLVLDFWASWCVPCRRSFPWMNEMQARYGDDGLVIVGVNMDAEAGDAAAFLQKYPADFEIAYDAGGVLAREFDVIAMPSTYIFDRSGNQVSRHLGFKVLRQAEYETILVETLKQ